MTPTIRFSSLFVGVQISHVEKQFAAKVASLTGNGRSTDFITFYFLSMI